MTYLYQAPPGGNPLASIVDPSAPLDAAEALLALASRFALHGHLDSARMALGLAWPTLHLAAMEASDPERLALLSAATREAEDALDAATVPVLMAVAL